MSSSPNLAKFFTARNVLLYLTAPVLVIGGLNWLATGVQNFRKQESATKSDDLLNALGLPSLVVNVIYILVGIAALGMLAFLFMSLFGPPSLLDRTFFPSTLVVSERAPDNANAAVKVRVTPFAKVAFWAAQPPVTPNTPYESELLAYGRFENAGVAVADANGDAVLRFRRPASYTVRGVTLEPHVHYRVAAGATAAKAFDAEIWGPVETVSDFQLFTRSE